MRCALFMKYNDALATATERNDALNVWDAIKGSRDVDGGVRGL